MKSEHSHIFITGLVYPGFLGAFLFDAVQNLPQFTIEQGFLVAALIFHYSGDYIYTADNERKKLYGTLRMFLDIALVVLLFLALRYALRSSPIYNFSCIWAYLAAFKFFSIIWEWAGKADKYRTQATIADAIFLFLYTLGWLAFPKATPILIAIIFLDASTYVWWESLCQSIMRHR